MKRQKPSTIEKRITDAFSEMEQRKTGSRRAIAQGLIGLGYSRNAFSAEDLLKRLRKQSPRIGRATVYRSMEKLVRMKVLDRVEFADGSHAFRLCQSGAHHHHLACNRCHEIVELDLCLDADLIAAIGKRQGFEIDDHSITLFGLCRECRKLKSLDAEKA